MLTDLLRACARLPEDARLDQIRQLVTDVQWPAFPAAAEAHGLAPLAHAHLTRAGASLPVDVQQQLFGLATRHRTANAVRFAALVRVLDAFEAASIRVLALKGAALAHLLYPSTALRPLSDIDLLVEPRQAEHAQGVLASLGFAADPRPPDRRFVGHHHLPPALLVQDGVFIQVEIHRDALSADTPGSLTLNEQSYARRQAFTIGGRTAYAFGHEEMLHHLTRHAAERASLFRLIWVTDIVAYATRFHAEIDWPALRQRDPFVINALSLLHLVTPLPPEVLAEVPMPRPGIAGAGTAFRPLAEIVRSDRPAGAVLRELLAPGEWWVRFYYGARSTPSFLWYLWIGHPTRMAWWFARRAVTWVRWRGRNRAA
ncbi:MAG: nucleotidyltransferase family protein [Acidobacteria bacterium]|nr:nucleotidyltransferase family protein [Acidobacteriota bacterium]